MNKTALLSVSNKEGIAEFARSLISLGFSIISTGGTAELLKKEGVKVEEASLFTGQEEILRGRVKTLHPKIFGGILVENQEDAKKNGLKMISLVCVNLYPFQEKVKEHAKKEEVIENIDIGGPSLLRAAAKNHEHVLVVHDPQDYKKIISALKNEEDTPFFRERLAAKVFAYTNAYDACIHSYFSSKLEEEFPETCSLPLHKVRELRYGENPHQKASLYTSLLHSQKGVASAKQLHGKELSYNNLLDSDDALSIVQDFEEPTAAIIKHTNPSGVASAVTIREAFKKAHDADPKSAFGCVVSLNRACDKETAELMRPLFVEVIVAPSFEEGALHLLSQKKNIRLLEVGNLKECASTHAIRSISGGILMQTTEFPTLKEENLEVVSAQKPNPRMMEDLLFAWKVNKHVKSNAVVFVKDKVTVGIGAGQMSRVDAVNLVGIKEESKTEGSVMSSDAYFPFRDGVDAAAKLGVKAIIQPGGSIRDKEVIQAADEHNIPMVFTGVRLFKH